MRPSSLRLVVAAFAANAALLVLQTLVFQLLPWDSSASRTLSVVFRVAFSVADVAALAAFVSLHRAEPLLRGFVSIAAVLAAFTVVSDLAGLGARALGSDAVALRAVEQTMGAAEPFASLGASVLLVLALRAVESRPRGAFTAVVVVSVVMSLGFRLVRVVDSGARSLPAAWISWLGEIARPVAIAALAFGIMRGLATAGAAARDAVSPYRAQGEGPTAPPVLGVSSAETASSLSAGAKALSLYRLAFAARIGSTIIGAMVLAGGSAMRGGGEAAVLVISLAPLMSLATGILIAVSLVMLLALPRTSGARGATIGALCAICSTTLADAGALLFALATLFDGSPHRAYRESTELFLLEWPFVAFFAGVSLLLVATAIGRTAEKLDAPLLTARARWIQGLAIACGVAQIGFVLAMIAYESTRWDYPRPLAGGVVCFVLAIAALASMIAVVALQLGLVGKARDALLAHAGRGAMPS